MLPVRFDPSAAKFIKKLKDKKLKKLYQEAIDKIREDYTIGERKTGDLSGFYGYDIFYNKTNYELAYTIENNIPSRTLMERWSLLLWPEPEKIFTMN